jgi:hypothetical protein
VTAVSPRPGEKDVKVVVHFTQTGMDLSYRACETAAKRFARIWSEHHHPDHVTVEPLRSLDLPRLTYEHLWLVP